MKNFVLILFVIQPFYIFSQQNYWQQSNGPFTFGGYINCMALDNNPVLWVGTMDDGIYCTTNLGGEWMHSGLYGQNINSIISLLNGYIFATTFNKLFRSSNNGSDWEEITNRLPSNNFNQISYNITGRVFLATTQGLFRSSDLGNGWIRIDSGFIDQRILKIVNGNNGKLYSIQDSSIYFSENGGENWNPINNLPSGHIWDLDCDSSNNLYLTINPRGVSIAIGYRSTNNGITWQQFGLSCPSLFWSIYISPDGNLFARGQYGIYKSINKGETWNLISTLTETTCLSFYSNDYLFSGSLSGVRKSINGGIDWHLVGLPGSYALIHSLAVDSVGNVFAGAGGNLPQVFRSTNHGQTWLNISGQFLGESISALSIDNNGNLLAGSYGGGIYYSSDYGASWGLRNNGLTSFSISSIKFDYSRNVYTGTWDGKFFKSTNHGNQWINCDVGINLILIDDIATSPSGNIYIGTGFGIFVSNNRGLSWTHLNNGWPPFSQSLAVDVNDQENIYADAFGHGIFRSTDLGNNWVLTSSNISSPIPDISINSLGNIFVAGANGVFRSTNNGEDWSLFNSGLPEWNGVNALVQDID